jgi:hypothetical protein
MEPEIFPKKDTIKGSVNFPEFLTEEDWDWM